jgi:putative transposase
MSKTMTIRHDVLVNEPLDPEVITFRRHFDDRSPLDDIIHEGARRMPR